MDDWSITQLNWCQMTLGIQVSVKLTLDQIPQKLWFCAPFQFLCLMGRANPLKISQWRCRFIKIIKVCQYFNDLKKTSTAVGKQWGNSKTDQAAFCNSSCAPTNMPKIRLVSLYPRACGLKEFCLFCYAEHAVNNSATAGVLDDTQWPTSLTSLNCHFTGGAPQALILTHLWSLLQLTDVSNPNYYNGEKQQEHSSHLISNFHYHDRNWNKDKQATNHFIISIHVIVGNVAVGVSIVSVMMSQTQTDKFRRGVIIQWKFRQWRGQFAVVLSTNTPILALLPLCYSPQSTGLSSDFPWPPTIFTKTFCNVEMFTLRDEQLLLVPKANNKC